VYPKADSSFEIVNMFMNTIEERQKKGGIGGGMDYYEFTSKIYDEYFDNRIYLMELYLDCLNKIME
jgi:hypothetical protein